MPLNIRKNHNTYLEKIEENSPTSNIYKYK